MISKKSIVLIGGGGHAKACADVILNCKKKYKIIGYTDIEQKMFDSIPYLGDDSVIYEYIDTSLFLICIGQIKSAELRKRMFDFLKQKGAEFATVISSNSYVSNTAIVDIGTIVMHGAIVQTGTHIGSNCIINDRALIEHDVKIGNNCHVSTGAIVNGNVIIGNNVFVGSGAILKNGSIIADDTIVGMGAIVTKNTKNGETVIGNPAKTIFS